MIWSAKPEVQYAQTNRIVAENRLIPDDTLFPFLWGMHNGGQTGGIVDADIDAPEAWDIFTGTSQTVVAVIDTRRAIQSSGPARQHVGQSGGDPRQRDRR